MSTVVTLRLGRVSASDDPEAASVPAATGTIVL
jgi:hypothetical protein